MIKIFPCGLNILILAWAILVSRVPGDGDFSTRSNYRVSEYIL